MTKRELQLAKLEDLCQQRYSIIDSCYNTIAAAQRDLAHLEKKYLKLKAIIDNPSPTQVKQRQSKIDKLRKSLSDLGLNETDILRLLENKK